MSCIARPPSRPQPRLRPLHPPLLALLALTTLALGSCVLREGKEYVIQPAPPTGIHATIRPFQSLLLSSLSAMVRKGEPVDGHLRRNGYRTRCDSSPNTIASGDRCVFRVLRATPVRGFLVGSYWNDATNWDMFTDFRRDSLGAFRSHPRRMRGGCVHVTIRNMGDWPIEWKNSNWTVRTRSDPKC